MRSPAIFLDRDGVLNENRADHVKNWSEFHFLPGTFEALRRLSALRLPIVIVTNQAAVSRQLMSRERLDDIHARMTEQLRRHGARVDAIFYCPHEPRDGCDCRKPEPGLLLAAARQLDIDLTRSVFVGDACTDIIAGQRVSCRTVLVLSGRGAESLRALRERHQLSAEPDAIARDLRGAVPVIDAMLAGTAAGNSFRLSDIATWFAPSATPATSALEA